MNGLNMAELLLIALALSTDAFTVAVARGIAGPRGWAADCLRTGVVFGALQAVMPVAGFYGGRLLIGGLMWSGGAFLAPLALFLLGLKLLWEGLRPDAAPAVPAKGRYWGVLAAQGVATSIDAMTVGLGLCGVTPGILFPAGVIGLVTLCVCLPGYLAGRILGNASLCRAQLAGGVILLALALHMLFH